MRDRSLINREMEYEMFDFPKRIILIETNKKQ